MNPHAKEKIDEISTRLATQLLKLGVEPVIKKDKKDYTVSFNAPGKFLPLSIVIPSTPKSIDNPSSWNGCYLYLEGWKAIDIGTQGWTYFEHENSGHKPLAGSGDDVFPMISEAIRNFDLVRQPGVDTKVIKNQSLVKAYEEMKGFLSIYGEITVEYSNVDGKEALTLTDPIGRDWKFAFKNGRVMAFVDGRRCQSFSQTDTWGMTNLMYERFMFEDPHVQYKF